MSDGEFDEFFDRKNQYFEPKDMDYYGQMNLEKLKSLQETVDWQVEQERYKFVHQLNNLIRNWSGRLPNLQDIFRTDEIECLLTDSLNCHDGGWNRDDVVKRLIWFVTRTGYRNEPDLDDDGKPLLRRTTPIHHAARRWDYDVVRQLFEIYNRFDVNYIDEFGYTHFHAACKFGDYDIVEKFLDLGQDPDCLPRESNPSSVDPPLILALNNLHDNVFELLLRRGANPNSTDSEGYTSLHSIIVTNYINYFMELFFKVCAEKRQPLHIDAQDNFGQIPLHLALSYSNENLVGLLLENGADLNATNAEGSTPLHIVCANGYDVCVEKLFEASKEKHQPLMVDARDKLGRTPLQLAVANCLPTMVDLLLDRGADLSIFVFPTESIFAKIFEKNHSQRVDYELMRASEALQVVERLEKGGYELDLSDALTIMKTFGTHKFLDKTENLDSWLSNEHFVRKTKIIMMNPSLSLYDLIQLRPDKAKNLLTHKDYFNFAIAEKSCLLPKGSRQVCVSHLYKKMWRGFCWRWALDSFLELTRYQLPILCCEKIIENLINEDLLRICQAAEIIANEQSQKLSMRSGNQGEDIQEFQNLNLN